MDVEQKAYMIDQVVSVDVPGRGVVRRLFDAAFKTVGGSLCLAAAQKLTKASRKGKTVFIITGFPILPQNIAETDGPPGAAVLANSLRAAQLEPVMMTDDLCLKVVEAAEPKTRTATISVNTAQAKEQAGRLLKKYKPFAVVSIERPGWNCRHEYHNMRGLNISSIVGKTDYLFETAKKYGAVTVGVGDGGNELGCGLISGTVRRHVPYGAKCQCPCNSGIAASTVTDVLVVGGVSNWAAYGISACFSLLNELPYQHDRQSELRLLRRVVKAGALDSISKEPRLYVDGLSPAINGLVVDLICAVANA